MTDTVETSSNILPFVTFKTDCIGNITDTYKEVVQAADKPIQIHSIVITPTTTESYTFNIQYRTPTQYITLLEGGFALDYNTAMPEILRGFILNPGDSILVCTGHNTQTVQCVISYTIFNNAQNVQNVQTIQQ